MKRLSILGRMRLAHKLSSIVVALSIPSALLMYLYVSEKNASIEFAQKEIDGVEYSRPVSDLQRALMAYRSVHRAYQAGERSVEGALGGTRSEVDEGIASVEAVETRHGVALKTAESWQAVKSAWETARGPGPQGADAALTETVTKVLELSARVGDTSNLILDPDLDSFYLMDAVVVKLPALLEDLSALRDESAAIARRGALSTDEKIALVNLVGKVLAGVEGAQRSLAAAFKNNATLEPRLAGQMATLAEGVAGLLALIDQSLVRAEAIAVPAAPFAEAGSRAVDAGAALYDAVAPVLSELLQKRIDGIARTRNIIAIAVAIGMVLALLFAVAVTRAVKGALRRIGEIANEIASGNLNNTITPRSQDEIGWTLSSLRSMQKKLAEVTGGIKSAADSVKAGAVEIAQGNTNLSQRTEEQASSLEETASSMEEMTGTVKQNADNAKQANQLAGSARDQAVEGGKVVSEAVAAMAEINRASKKIGDIIGVIDEIAFQTNLLALNAAVEAARAGEQGRGFAVVASEVRNLAQRSAGAAKEIKELIQDSVRKAEEGAKLVDESGATLTQIVTAVKKVSDVIAEIATASQEQSAGIEQVNKAVLQMDEVTQQNAALVEQAAAASQSMDEQAGNLQQLMAFFKIEEGAAVLAATKAAPAPAPKERKSLAPVAERRQSRRPWNAEKNEAMQGRTAEKSAVQRVAVAQGNAAGGWEEF